MSWFLVTNKQFFQFNKLKHAIISLFSKFMKIDRQTKFEALISKETTSIPTSVDKNRSRIMNKLAGVLPESNFLFFEGREPALWGIYRWSIQLDTPLRQLK
jgi:hypothetical protein